MQVWSEGLTGLKVRTLPAPRPVTVSAFPVVSAPGRERSTQALQHVVVEQLQGGLLELPPLPQQQAADSGQADGSAYTAGHSGLHHRLRALRNHSVVTADQPPLDVVPCQHSGGSNAMPAGPILLPPPEEPLQPPQLASARQEDSSSPHRDLLPAGLVDNMGLGIGIGASSSQPSLQAEHPRKRRRRHLKSQQAVLDTDPQTSSRAGAETGSAVASRHLHTPSPASAPGAAGIPVGSSPQLTAEEATALAAATAITQQIARSSTVEQLCQILVQHCTTLNHIHVSAMLDQLASLAPGAARGMSFNCEKGSPQQSPKSQKQVPKPAQSGRGGQQGQQRQQRHQPSSKAFPRMQKELFKQPAEPLQRLPIRSYPTEGGTATGAAVARQQVLWLVHHLVALVKQHLPVMSLYEVSSIMAAFVKLHARVGKPVLISLMEQASRKFRQPSTQSRGLVQLIWAVMRSGMRGLRPDWGSRFCAAVAARWESCDAHELCRLVHALAWLGHRPTDAWVASWCSYMQQCAWQASPQDISLALWACARLRVSTPPELTSALCDAALPQAPLFQGQELSNLMWGLARLGHTPSPDLWEAVYSQATYLLAAGQLSGQSSALLVYAAGLLGMQPPKHWLESVVQQTQQSGFAGLGPQSMALLVYGLAQLGHHPGTGWLGDYHRRLGVMPDRFQPAGVELIRLAFQMLSFDPPRAVPTQPGGSSSKPRQAAGWPARLSGPQHSPELMVLQPKSVNTRSLFRSEAAQEVDTGQQQRGHHLQQSVYSPAPGAGLQLQWDPQHHASSAGSHAYSPSSSSAQPASELLHSVEQDGMWEPSSSPGIPGPQPNGYAVQQEHKLAVYKPSRFA